MNPLRITLDGVRTWAGVNIDLPTGCTAITGPNGAGKSTLVAAIDVALFGTGRELARAATRGGTGEVAVTLDYEHAGRTYRVCRWWRAAGGGKSGLEWTDTTDPEPIVMAGTTMAETQAQLEASLGLTRATYRASAYLAQGDQAAFTAAAPRDRKELLSLVVDPRGTWPRLHALAAADRKRDEAAVLTAKARVDDLGAVVAESENLDVHHAGLTNRAERIAQLIAGTTSDLGHAQAALSAAREQAAAHSAAVRELHLRRQVAQDATAKFNRAETEAAKELGLRALLAGQRQQAATLDMHQATADGLRDKIAGAAAAVTAEQRARAHVATCEADEAAARQRVAAAAAKARTARAAIDQHLGAETPQCPTCGQHVHGDAYTAALDKLREAKDTAERLASDEVAAADAAFERLTAATSAHADALAQVPGHLHVLQAELSTATAAVRAARQAAESAARTEQELAAAVRAAEALPGLRSEAARLAIEADHAAAALVTPPDTVALAARVTDLQAQLASLGGDRDTTAHTIGKLAAQLEAAGKAAADLDAARVELAQAQDRLRVSLLLEEACSRDGVPARILEATVLPQLAQEATRVASALGRPYTFELRTERATKGGGLVDALDIVVHTPTGEALYEDFSGGERTRVDVAVRVGLAVVLASRRGAEVGVLCLDEPSYLDDHGMRQLAAVLRDLQQVFPRILVVSLVPGLRDVFDHSIVVAGGGDTGEPSRLERAA